MKVAIIGTGYVGLVSGTCFSEIGHDVTCIDIDPKKIDMLKKAQSPIYEPGLEEMLKRNIEKERLHFSSSFDCVAESQVIFLAVGTPSNDEGRADLKYLLSATESIIPYLSDDKVVVIKSTVPVGTNELIRTKINESTQSKVYVVNNPEFLKEGSAIDDFMKPDRVVIGHDNDQAAQWMRDLYEPLVRQGNPILCMSNLSAEMTKYAANCFLATKISFINEVARLCDKAGADIEEVRKGIMSDQRIGHHFLYPGPGYGGSCFPKDVKALMATACDYGMELEIVKAAENVNKKQKSYIVEKMKEHFGPNFSGKTIALWGVAFKANTDDIRETPAIDVVSALLSLGANIRFYDPVASKNFVAEASKQNWNLEASKSAMSCLDKADALVILTEWAEFKNPNLAQIREQMNEAVIFDARNLLSTKQVLKENLKYYAIGKRI